jgi:phage-related minor tail protein
MTESGKVFVTTALDLGGLAEGLDEAKNHAQTGGNDIAASLSGALSVGLAGVAGIVGGAFLGIGAAVVGETAAAQQGLRDMQAQLGVTADEAAVLQDAAIGVFGNNFGDNMDDAIASVIEVRQQMKNLSDEEIQAVTEGALAIRDAFGEDVSKTTNAANVLMQEYGLTSQQALDFIAKGFQEGLNTSGDFLDSISEYGGMLASNGMNAEQFFGIMQNGLQGGVLGTDKAVDALKEFSIRIMEIGDDIFGKDGALRFELGDAIGRSLQIPENVINDVSQDADLIAETLNGIGLSVNPDMLREPLMVWNEQTGQFVEQTQTLGDVLSTAISEGLADGTFTAAQAQELMNAGLNTMEDQVARNSAGVKLYGTMWEDMGSEAVLQMGNVSTGLDDMSGATESLNVQYGSLSSIGTALWRELLVTLMPFADALLNMASNAMPSVIAAFQLVRGAIESAFGGEGTAQATGAMATIQGAMATLVSAIQIGLALIQQFWAENGAEITAFVMATWAQITGIFTTVFEIISLIVNEGLAQLALFWEEHGADILILLETAWANIQLALSGALEIIQGLLNTFLALLKGDWATAWEEIQGVLQVAWETISGIFQNLGDAVVGIWNNHQDQILAKAQEIWDGIKEAISTAIQSARDTVQSTLDGILTFIGGMGDRARRAGEGFINNMKDGLLSAVDGMVNAAKNALGPLADLLPGSEPKDTSSPLYGLGDRGRAFVGNFSDGITSAMPELTKTVIDGLGSTMNAVEGAMQPITESLSAEFGRGLSPLGGALGELTIRNRDRLAPARPEMLSRPSWAESMGLLDEPAPRPSWAESMGLLDQPQGSLTGGATTNITINANYANQPEMTLRDDLAMIGLLRGV